VVGGLRRLRIGVRNVRKSVEAGVEFAELDRNPKSRKVNSYCFIVWADNAGYITIETGQRFFRNLALVFRADTIEFFAWCLDIMTMKLGRHSSSSAWIDLGDLYGKQAQPEDAITAWKAAIALDEAGREFRWRESDVRDGGHPGKSRQL